jgi:hypothetical protein
MKKLLLIAAMAAMALGASADSYKIEKVWTLNAPTIFTATNDVRQGFGMNGKFYIHNKVDQLVYEVDQNGLTGVTFEGGANCGISRDQAGNIIVSNATFPGSWVEATIKVINPATGDVVQYTVPEETGLLGRCDFIGFAKGNLLEDGALYLTGGNSGTDPYTDGIAILTITGGEVDYDYCYTATCAGLSTNTSTVINFYNDINGEDALLYAYRSGAPGKLLADGDNFTRTGLILPNKGACNGIFPIVWDGKEFYLYPILPNYQDGFAVAESGTINDPGTPIVTVPSSVAANPNGFQGNWLNAEVDADGVTIYQYVPGGQISVYRLTKEADAPKVYILGEVNENSWAPNQGLLMDYDAENKVYTADVTFDGRGASGENYFSFTTELAEFDDEGSWAYIAPFRFGAVSDNDFWFDDMYNGQPLGLTYENGQAFRVMGGNYQMTVSLEDMTMTLWHWQLGDVNHDRAIDVGDVTMLISAILNGSDVSGFYLSEANCDRDEGESIDVGDVTALISRILTDEW